MVPSPRIAGLPTRRTAEIVGLGPAFGTKYLYFTQPPPQGPRALIVDALVTEWLDRETDLGFAAGAFSVPTYGRYLEMMHDWAASLGCEPDELESCMFRAIATERGSQWGGAAINTPGAGSGTRRRRNRAAAIKPPGRLTPEGMKGGSRVQGPFRTDVYAGVVRAAVDGRLVAYSDLLPDDPRHVGIHLYAIADYEHAHRRPPLTALVVRKHGGRPGQGFSVVADQIGYRRPGESDADVWERACAEVFDYWRP